MVWFSLAVPLIPLCSQWAPFTSQLISTSDTLVGIEQWLSEEANKRMANHNDDTHVHDDYDCWRWVMVLLVRDQSDVVSSCNQRYQIALKKLCADLTSQGCCLLFCNIRAEKQPKWLLISESVTHARVVVMSGDIWHMHMSKAYAMGNAFEWLPVFHFHLSHWWPQKWDSGLLKREVQFSECEQSQGSRCKRSQNNTQTKAEYKSHWNWINSN